MTTFLGEVGKRILDQWFTILVLPGLLFVAVVITGDHLGHAHALDVRALSAWVTAQLAPAHSSGAGEVVLAVAAALLAAAGAGLSAAALGRLTAYLWALPDNTVPARWRTRRRRLAWDEANDRVAAAVDAAMSGADPNGYRAEIAARDHIALVRPEHPTWIGDRLTAPAARVKARYGLDLGAAWPRLWLIVPDQVRTEITAAHTAYMAAARLAGWTAMYAIVAIIWWPSALVALGTAIAAHVQSRAAAATLADLTEATIDLYGPALAKQLSVKHDGKLTPDTGFAITAMLRKDIIPAPCQAALLARRATTAERPAGPRRRLLRRAAILKRGAR